MPSEIIKKRQNKRMYRQCSHCEEYKRTTSSVQTYLCRKCKSGKKTRKTPVRYVDKLNPIKRLIIFLLGFNNDFHNSVLSVYNICVTGKAKNEISYKKFLKEFKELQLRSVFSTPIINLSKKFGFRLTGFGVEVFLCLYNLSGNQLIEAHKFFVDFKIKKIRPDLVNKAFEIFEGASEIDYRNFPFYTSEGRIYFFSDYVRVWLSSALYSDTVGRVAESANCILLPRLKSILVFKLIIHREYSSIYI